MQSDLTAFDDHILRILWFMTGGIGRLVNVKQLLEQISHPLGQPASRVELEASLQRLENQHFIDGRKGRVGYMLVKLTDAAVTHIHQSQLGIPSFYTRNVDALRRKDLHKFMEELNRGSQHQV
jgi:hypothetical protein